MEAFRSQLSYLQLRTEREGWGWEWPFHSMLGFAGLEPFFDGLQPVDDVLFGAVQAFEQARDVGGQGQAEIPGRILDGLVLHPLQVGDRLEIVPEELEERGGAHEIVETAGNRVEPAALDLLRVASSLHSLE